MKHFITLAGLIIIGSFLVFLYDCITGLADFAGRMHAPLEPWVFWALFLAVAGLLAWMMGVALLRPRPMMVYADPDDGDRAAFRRELTRRLKRNRFLREAGYIVKDESDLEGALAALKTQANEEIRQTGKRVFVGTAISQNGRLDTLVVLYLITRLTWRVAKLYNQRPHYREMVNLYVNIAATSFLAGSIEEFGIEEYISELMGPLVGGSAIGAVPGAQAIASTVTASVLTGSTNGLLAMRCGVVARDFVSLNLDAKGAMRRSATLEATKMFMSMSADTVTYVTKALVKGSADAVKSGTSRAVRGVGDTVSDTAEAVGNGAMRVGRGMKSTAETLTRGVGETVGAVGNEAQKAGRTVINALNSAAKKARQTGRTVHDRGKSILDRAKSGIANGLDALKKASDSLNRKRTK